MTEPLDPQRPPQRPPQQPATQAPHEDYRELAGILAGLLFVTYPATLPTLAVGYLASEKRRVRQGWWITWWAASTLLGILVAGGFVDYLGRAIGVIAAPWMALFGDTITKLAALSGLNMGGTITALAAWSVPTIIGWHILIGTPIGLVATIGVNYIRNYQRRELGRIEGDDYANIRPVGVLDKHRTTRTTQRIKDGKCSTTTRGGGGASVVGVGKYGAPALVQRESLKRPTATIGVPRSGKTRLGNSLGGQEVRAGSGAAIIDFKGDPLVARHYAEIAQESQRSFLHFQLFGKASGGYSPPHPYAPPQPAYYDPLVRGNGASKASMLLDSVSREGDAAAYVRTAYEVVQLAYDVAAMTGYSQGRGGFEVLARMLDIEFLQHQVDLLTPDMVTQIHSWMPPQQIQRRVGLLHNRTQVLTKQVKTNPVLKGAISDTQSLISTYQQSPAGGSQLQPGPPALTIDLVRAVLRGEIVVFSLPTQDYPSFARVVGTMVLLDLQNAVSTLRHNAAALSGMTRRSGGMSADGTPWDPFWVQVEEFGSAGTDAVLGLLNKSSDAGFRTLLSTQSWSDVVAVDDTGVFGRRVLDQIGNLFSFQVGERDSSAVVSDFSGQVGKLLPVEDLNISKGNRWGFGKGAARAKAARTTSSDQPRVGYGQPQGLSIDPHHGSEIIWVSKQPEIRAVHTVAEGPNQWFEIVRLVPVRELPYEHNPFADTEMTASAQRARDEHYRASAQAIATDPVLARVLDTRNEATDVEAHTSGSATFSAGSPTEPEPHSTVPQEYQQGSPMTSDEVSPLSPSVFGPSQDPFHAEATSVHSRPPQGQPKGDSATPTSSEQTAAGLADQDDTGSPAWRDPAREEAREAREEVPWSSSAPVDTAAGPASQTGEHTEDRQRPARPGPRRKTHSTPGRAAPDPADRDRKGSQDPDGQTDPSRTSPPSGHTGPEVSTTSNTTEHDPGRAHPQDGRAPRIETASSEREHPGQTSVTDEIADSGGIDAADLDF